MKAPVIHSWTTESNSDPGKWYETILRGDGKMECPCRGWTMAKFDRAAGINEKIRVCVHTKTYEHEGTAVLRAYQDEPTARAYAMSLASGAPFDYAPAKPMPKPAVASKPKLSPIVATPKTNVQIGGRNVPLIPIARAPQGIVIVRVKDPDRKIPDEIGERLASIEVA